MSNSEIRENSTPAANNANAGTVEAQASGSSEIEAVRRTSPDEFIGGVSRIQSTLRSYPVPYARRLRRSARIARRVNPRNVHLLHNLQLLNDFFFNINMSGDSDRFGADGDPTHIAADVNGATGVDVATGFGNAYHSGRGATCITADGTDITGGFGASGDTGVGSFAGASGSSGVTGTFRARRNPNHFADVGSGSTGNGPPSVTHVIQTNQLLIELHTLFQNRCLDRRAYRIPRSNEARIGEILQQLQDLRLIAHHETFTEINKLRQANQRLAVINNQMNGTMIPVLPLQMRETTDINACLICFERVMNKAPIALPCGHVLCGSCAERVRTSEMPRCPVCRRRIYRNRFLRLYP